MATLRERLAQLQANQRTTDHELGQTRAREKQLRNELATAGISEAALRNVRALLFAGMRARDAAEQLAHSRRRLEEVEATLQQHEARLFEVARSLGMTGGSADELVRDVQQRCARAREIATRWSEADERVRFATARLEERRAEHARATRTLETLLAKLAAWRTDCDRAGIPGEVTPEGFEGFLANIRAIRVARDTLEQAERDCALRRDRIEAFETSVARLCVALGEPERAAFNVLPGLMERLQRARDARTERAAADRALAESEAVAWVRRTARDEAERALSEFLAALGLASVADARAAAERLADMEQARRDLDAASGAIRAATGREPDAPELVAAFADADPARWETELEALGSRIAELTEAASRASEELGGLFKERSDILARADVAELAATVATLQQEKHEALVQLLTWSLESHLLDRALHRFQEEHQPAVFARASSLFATMTEGAWTRVRAALDETDIEVVDSRGEMRPPEVLSSGTAEQLYLSLRLALVETLSDAAPSPLPIVLDDVLVNFDDVRAAACATVLGRVAEGRQVLVLACHERTRALLAAAVPGMHVVHLPRFAGGDRPVALEVSARTEDLPTDDLTTRILERLKGAREPLGKSDLIDESDAPRWPGAIRRLLEIGAVRQFGTRRGARYELLR